MKRLVWSKLPLISCFLILLFLFVSGCGGAQEKETASAVVSQKNGTETGPAVSKEKPKKDKEQEKPGRPKTESPAKKEAGEQGGKTGMGKGLEKSETVESKSKIEKKDERGKVDTGPRLPPGFKEAVALAEHNPAQAKARFKAFLRQTPNLYQAQVNLAILADREGNLGEAERELKAALAIAPQNKEALYTLLRVLKEQGRINEAVSIIERTSASDPENNDLKNVLASALIQKGDLSRAEKLTKSVLKDDERNVDAMMNLGDIYAKEEKHELSSFIYEKAAELDPSNADIWYRHARELMKLFKLTGSKAMRAKAILSLKKAVAVDPSHALAQNNLGVMLLKSGDSAGALQALKAAAMAMPNSFDIHLNLGDAFRAARMYKEADQEYKKALKLKPDNPKALFNLGLLYLDNNVPGYDDLVKRLSLAVDYLRKYKDAMGPRLAADDPAQGYLEDAEKLKKREVKRREHAEKRRLRRLKRQEEERKRKEEERKKKEEEEKEKKIEEAKKADLIKKETPAVKTEKKATNQDDSEDEEKLDEGEEK
ncbi:MAG: tetratricopeptide repeat protein [Deltaproteobacteria bacterium]|nr:tetratricopeptide repeat protein [Deltaproteobacteria bacterium]